MPAVLVRVMVLLLSTVVPPLEALANPSAPPSSDQLQILGMFGRLQFEHAAATRLAVAVIGHLHRAGGRDRAARVDSVGGGGKLHPAAVDGHWACSECTGGVQPDDGAVDICAAAVGTGAAQYGKVIIDGGDMGRAVEGESAGTLVLRNGAADGKGAVGVAYAVYNRGIGGQECCSAEDGAAAGGTEHAPVERDVIGDGAAEFRCAARIDADEIRRRHRSAPRLGIPEAMTAVSPVVGRTPPAQFCESVQLL